MVPVIKLGLDEEERVKRDAFDTPLLKLPRVLYRVCADASEVVVHDAHVNALPCFKLKDIDDGVPELSGLNDEILYVDILLCKLQIFEHILEHVFAKRIVLRSSVRNDGKTGGIRQVPERLPNSQVGLLDVIKDLVSFCLTEFIFTHEAFRCKHPG